MRQVTPRRPQPFDPVGTGRRRSTCGGGGLGELQGCARSDSGRTINPERPESIAAVTVTAPSNVEHDGE